MVAVAAAAVVVAGNHLRLRLPKFRGICYSRNMNKKILLVVFIGIILIGTAIFVFLKYGKPQESKIILFYGENCPFCAKVDEFVQDNKIEEKISFEKKEVYNNKDNAAELLEKAAKCGLAQDEIGVPFLWDGSKCFVGDEDIINFFKQKVGIQ